MCMHCIYCSGRDRGRGRYACTPPQRSMSQLDACAWSWSVVGPPAASEDRCCVVKPIHLLKIRTHKNFDFCSKDRSGLQDSRRCLLSVWHGSFSCLLAASWKREARVRLWWPSSDLLVGALTVILCQIILRLWLFTCRWNIVPRLGTSLRKQAVAWDRSFRLQAPALVTMGASEVDSNAGDDDNEPDVARSGVDVETRKGKGRRRGQESRRRYTLAFKSSVLDMLDKMISSRVTGPIMKCVDHFSISHSLVAKWSKAHHRGNICRHWRALDTGSVQTPKQRKRLICIQEQRPATMTRR